MGDNWFQELTYMQISAWYMTWIKVACLNWKDVIGHIISFFSQDKEYCNSIPIFYMIFSFACTHDWLKFFPPKQCIMQTGFQANEK